MIRSIFLARFFSILNMEEEFMVLMLLVSTSACYLLTKRKRRYAVRPVNRLRSKNGMYFDILTSILVNKDVDLFRYFRMTPKRFFHSLPLVKQKLKEDPSKHPIVPARRSIPTLQEVSQIVS